MSTCKRSSKHLFFVWKLLFAFFSIATSICFGYFQGVREIDLQTMPNVFQLILIAIIMFMFIPFLLFVYKKAKQENSSEISNKAVKLIWTLGIASGGTLLCNLLSIFIPGLFD